MPSNPMKASLTVDGRTYLWDPSRHFDLSRPTTFRSDATQAFGLPRPRVESLPIPGLRCATVHDLNPHTLTHLESARHLGEPAPSIQDALDRFHFLATLASVEPSVTHDGDRVVTAAQLATILPAPSPFLEAVIVRTLPNGPDKIHRRYTGTNPPYLEATAAACLRDRGVRVLLVDLPSLDREEDGGALAAHRAFFGSPSPVDAGHPSDLDLPARSPQVDLPTPASRAVGELIYVPSELPDGVGLLHLIALPWDLDASPVRPIFHSLEPIR